MDTLEQLFKQAMSRFPSGVTVITTYDKDGVAVGMTASAFISVSLTPPLVLESVAKSAQMHKRLMEQDRYAVNILSTNQVNVSNHFAGWGIEGFEPELEEQDGLPIIKGSIAQFICRIMSRVDTGDHTLFIAQVKSVEVEPSGETPLVYASRGYHTLNPVSEE